MSVVIENPETKETRTVEMIDGKYDMPPFPWRVKGTLANLERQEKRNAAMQRFTMIAADFGLPAHVFQAAGGWLLGCARCTTTVEVTALYEQGKISKEQHKDFFIRVANAIDQKDQYALKELKGKLEALRKH